MAHPAQAGRNEENSAHLKHFGRSFMLKFDRRSSLSLPLSMSKVELRSLRFFLAAKEHTQGVFQRVSTPVRRPLLLGEAHCQTQQLD